jgi:hypothetical protein
MARLQDEPWHKPWRPAPLFESQKPLTIRTLRFLIRLRLKVDYSLLSISRKLSLFSHPSRSNTNLHPLPLLLLELQLLSFHVLDLGLPALDNCINYLSWQSNGIDPFLRGCLHPEPAFDSTGVSGEGRVKVGLAYLAMVILDADVMTHFQAGTRWLGGVFSATHPTCRISHGGSWHSRNDTCPHFEWSKRRWKQRRGVSEIDCQEGEDEVGDLAVGHGTRVLFDVDIFAMMNASRVLNNGKFT